MTPSSTLIIASITHGARLDVSKHTHRCLGHLATYEKIIQTLKQTEGLKFNGKPVLAKEVGYIVVAGHLVLRLDQ